ncbi:hypothetical protein HAZT_HAZT011981 [Hyalella azteca]|uniref:Ig-like domain-containing protein n=1 Tax=Hyalella azteca TaxID=294128 RepID=A0A6A0GZX4_HYAAZ|nr:hypothetical protein HAZT_HAZT011981 [Hyalella azteca]
MSDDGKFQGSAQVSFLPQGLRSQPISRLHSKLLKPYIKYPSPFPEDNSFQAYSGSSGQSEERLHALLNNSYPYPVSSSTFDRYPYPYQRDPLRASEDMSAGDLGAREFPGLLGAPPIQYSSLSGPSFVADSKENFYAVAGTTAILTCTIRNLHNHTVSWVRGRDIRLLTTGLITYTSDKRFVPSNPARGQDWLLKIHYSRKQDEGSYLCQVSLSPPITKTMQLHVNGERGMLMVRGAC